MKKLVLMLALAAMLAVLTGCGAIIVEDSTPVRIGCNHCVKMFT